MNRAVPSSDDLKLLSHIGEVVALHADELSARLQEVLEATSSFHEHLLLKEEVVQLSRRRAGELIEAFNQQSMYFEPEVVKEQGAQVALQGLGDKALVDSLSVFQELCLSYVIQTKKDVHNREQALVVAARALNCYASLFVEGFLQATRDRILEAQDEMIEALEKSLHESEQWLATTLNSIGDGVIATDTRGRVTFVNPVAEQLTGWSQEEAAGNLLGEVFHIINEKTRERCDNPFEKIMKLGRIVGLANHTVLVAKDGTERPIADSGAPIRDEPGNILGTVVVFHDITEQKRMEDDILKLKTERMESISILAGGIAHDFNNILTGILGSTSLAKLCCTEEMVKEKLTKIEKAALQAKDLTQQLLTFSKGGAPIKRITSLGELIKDSTMFALRGSKARYHFEIPADLWPVEVDEGQISQVISNLIINADQAMPTGGAIQVEAQNITCNSDSSLPLDPGKYVEISIKDQGVGIPEKNLTKIFDPYFTTKEGGSGLGLTTSYSIIKNHDGLIMVESELGVGTTFYMYLPASKGEVRMRKEEIGIMAEGKGKILLMDDEESILDATGEVLVYLGYEVEVARDGLEAIELYKKAQDEDPFDAVIVDLTIRGKMGGRETIQHLLEIDPSVKAIVSSGYSDDPVMANYREYGFSGVVRKPYTIKELNRTLHEVLGDL